MKPQSILDFLTELKTNNNREWFNQRKEHYDSLRKYFESLSSELIERIAEFDADIKGVTAKECVFRIYRDIRFSHDKTPYKTHFGVYIAARGGRKSERGGYYLHLDPDGCLAATGVWCPTPSILKALRQSVFDNIDELNEICNTADFKKYNFSFAEDGKLKTVPAGFPKDFPQADFLKYKHYIVEKNLDAELLNAPDFTNKIIEIFRAAYPLNKFLNYTIDEING
ncbi:MAG: DUF2461 domain-containing protein [Paludibacter sp.]|jgi:uncharacterized protein (TIGR02453 family)|nr:DUF2461 domain-containing protein [Paludibacter sp.]